MPKPKLKLNSRCIPLTSFHAKLVSVPVFQITDKRRLECTNVSHSNSNSNSNNINRSPWANRDSASIAPLCGLLQLLNPHLSTLVYQGNFLLDTTSPISRFFFTCINTGLFNPQDFIFPYIKKKRHSPWIRATNAQPMM